MDKGIGFSRTIMLDWLDATASKCIEGVEIADIRQQLASTISGSVQGVEAQRKTIDVLIAIWIKTEATAPKIRKQALETFPTLTSSEERMWLHYGMTLVCYPFFRKCVAVIGQINRTADSITRKMIKDRIAGDYGHLGALDRSVERIMASILDWGVLANTDQEKKYRVVTPSYSSTINLQTWLLTCALFSHPSEAIPFDDLIHLPELFPFRFTVNVDNLRRDSRFELQRQGGGLVMVRLNNS